MHGITSLPFLSINPTFSPRPYSFPPIETLATLSEKELILLYMHFVNKFPFVSIKPSLPLTYSSSIILPPIRTIEKPSLKSSILSNF